MWLEELLAEYNKVIEALELPLPEANKELERIEAEVQESSNPLIQLMMPSLVGTNQRHANVDARIAELETRLGVAAAVKSEASTERNKNENGAGVAAPAEDSAEAAPAAAEAVEGEKRTLVERILDELGEQWTRGLHWPK